MPFKAKEKRREYSRLWARRKAATTEPKPLYSVTVSEIPDLKKLKTYDECVEKSRELIKFKRISQLVIGGLALRACEIRWGGNQKEETLKPRLTEFAEAIGVSNKTLCDWVKARRLCDDLPSEIKIEYTTAHYALREAKNHGGNPVAIYQRLVQENSRLKQTLGIERFCGSLYFLLKKHGGNQFSARELEALRKIQKEINERLGG